MFAPRPSTPAVLHPRPGWTVLAVTALVFGASNWISVSMSPPALQALKSLLIAPVIEEAFFRGVVHAGLRCRTDRLGRPWPAIALTAFGFGVAHLVSAPPTHAVAVTVPALAIGWIYERSRSIALCVVVHAACNAIWFSARSIG
jgi:membrane protease YdiL (CAAX protease family)